MSVLPELLSMLEKMSETQQRELLAQLRPSEKPIGEPGWLFVERTRHIHLPTEDAEDMLRVIEEGCEGIEDDEPPVFSS
jgi:hypothetical protein